MTEELEKILDVNNDYLDSIHLEYLIPFTEQYGVPKAWIYEKSGREHYRLLVYVGFLFENKNIIDVGTYQGTSALSLGLSGINQIISFDVLQQPEVRYITNENIKFKLGDILNDENVELLLSSPFIMLDTAHEGPFEYAFYSHLKKIGYKGLLLLDDINLNDEMRGFWKSIEEEKYDLTSKGHWSGTGIVNL